LGLAFGGAGRKVPVQGRVVGPWVGNHAAYGRSGDTMIFLRNQSPRRCRDIATRWFRFLELSPADKHNRAGRCASLFAEARSRRISDLLSVDGAFTSDSTPSIFLTREGLCPILRHLKQAACWRCIFHSVIELAPVVALAAREDGQNHPAHDHRPGDDKKAQTFPTGSWFP